MVDTRAKTDVIAVQPSTFYRLKQNLRQNECLEIHGWTRIRIDTVLYLTHCYAFQTNRLAITGKLLPYTPKINDISIFKPLLFHDAPSCSHDAGGLLLLLVVAQLTNLETGYLVVLCRLSGRSLVLVKAVSMASCIAAFSATSILENRSNISVTFNIQKQVVQHGWRSS